MKSVFVELAGFEPVAFSLRKMWSKPADQGKRHALTVYGAAVVRAT